MLPATLDRIPFFRTSIVPATSKQRSQGDERPFLFSLFMVCHGRRQAVLLSYAEWERLLSVPSFGRLLMAVPLSPEDLPRRDRRGLRPPGL